MARNICVDPQIIVMDNLWANRAEYLEELKSRIRDLPFNSIIFSIRVGSSAGA